MPEKFRAQAAERLGARIGAMQLLPPHYTQLQIESEVRACVQEIPFERQAQASVCYCDDLDGRESRDWLCCASVAAPEVQAAFRMPG
ncbi:hypothetical protein MRX96_013010 [Rhipicephalus microplus]